MKLKSVQCQNPVNLAGTARRSFQTGEQYGVEMMAGGLVMVTDLTRNQAVIISPAEWSWVCPEPEVKKAKVA